MASWWVRLGNSYSVLFVSLGNFNRFLVFLVLSEDQSRDSSELLVVVTLDLLGEADSIDTLVGSNGLSQSFEVLDLEIKGIEGVVDSLVVLVLNRLKPFNNQRQVSSSSDLG